MVAIKGLSFYYNSQQLLFQGLSLEIEPGNIYGLLGKNGAGKTTLLKILAGLIFPNEGDTSVFGCTPGHRKAEMLEDLYFLPEEFYVPKLSGNTYVKLYAPFYPRFDDTLFREAAAEFEIDCALMLTDLSYGQKKKFLTAFGIATNCALTIFDEPSNGLDIPSKSRFRRLLASGLTEERSFIISTHQVRDVESLIDPIIILHDGEIVFNHTGEEISRALSVEIKKQLDEGDFLYAEKVIGGHAVLEVNTARIESNVDIELLFNAVITRPDRVRDAFESGNGGKQ
jgi:ABC-2 type transport system ATP-binding protein